MSKEIKLNKDLRKKLDDFNAAAAAAAEDVLIRVFPSKILELQELIVSMSSPTSPFHMSNATIHTDTAVYSVHAEPAASDEPDNKKRKLADGVNGVHNLAHSADTVNGGARFTQSMHSNKHVKQVYAILKKECEDLADAIDKVKLWVNLSMPKIEDGDNFGVQIQEEVLTELHRSQEVAFNLRDTARLNFANRGKLCSKIIKYPNIEDYTLALQEHDEKQLYITRQNLHDIRNIYAVLTDILHKNISKIRSPKGNNATGLY